MWRGVGEKKHQLLSTFTCSPLTCNSSNYQSFWNPSRNRGNRGPVIEEDMKLPAQTNVAGARRGFMWLRNLGALCVNTHTSIYMCKPSHTHTYTPHSNPPSLQPTSPLPTPPPALKKTWTVLHVPQPSASELWEEAKSQTDVLLAAQTILAFLTSHYSSFLKKKKEFSQKNHASFVNMKKWRPLTSSCFKQSVVFTQSIWNICNGRPNRNQLVADLKQQQQQQPL